MAERTTGQWQRTKMAGGLAEAKEAEGKVSLQPQKEARGDGGQPGRKRCQAHATKSAVVHRLMRPRVLGLPVPAAAGKGRRQLEAIRRGWSAAIRATSRSKRQPRQFEPRPRRRTAWPGPADAGRCWLGAPTTPHGAAQTLGSEGPPVCSSPRVRETRAPNSPETIGSRWRMIPTRVADVTGQYGTTAAARAMQNAAIGMATAPRGLSVRDPHGTNNRATAALVPANMYLDAWRRDRVTCSLQSGARSSSYSMASWLLLWLLGLRLADSRPCASSDPTVAPASQSPGRANGSPKQRPGCCRCRASLREARCAGSVPSGAWQHQTPNEPLKKSFLSRQGGGAGRAAAVSLPCAAKISGCGAALAAGWPSVARP